MADILSFPKNKIVREPTKESLRIRKLKRKGTENYANAVVDNILFHVLAELEDSGIEIGTDQFQKDFIITADSLRSAVYRFLGLKHHMHSFIDRNVRIINDGDVDETEDAQNPRSKKKKEKQIDNEKEL